MITFNDSTNIVHYTLSDDERRWKKKCYKQCQILGTLRMKRDRDHMNKKTPTPQEHISRKNKYDDRKRKLIEMNSSCSSSSSSN